MFLFSFTATRSTNGSRTISASPFYFQSVNHPGHILQSLQEIYRERLFCDVTLVINEQEFPAHRIVLAAGSPYFSAMFKNDLKESTQTRISLKDVDPLPLESLISFLYSSSLVITESNVQALLHAASLLGIMSVVEACCDFLLARLDPENCLGMYQFADIHGCSSLAEASWKYALEHFREVMESEEFLSLSSNHLQTLIQSGDVQVQTEVDILDSVLLWYSHNRPERVKHLPSLIQYIKLPLISQPILQEKVLNGVFPPNDPLHTLIASQLNGFLSTHVTDFDPYHPRQSTRHSLIYMVGGETFPRTTVNTVEEYDPLKNTWRELASVHIARRGVGLGIIDNFIYVMGGSDGRDALRLVERYDPNLDKWMRVADLNQERSSVSGAVVNGVLYAVGGYNGYSSCLKSVEKYNPESDSWSYVSEMNISRSMSATAILNNKLYIFGGYDGASDLSSCEVYDPLTDKWTLIAEMGSPRCMSSAGVLGETLYVVGGCYCSRSLSMVDSYDPNTNQWTSVNRMTEARSGVGVAVVGNKMYALGGYTGTGYCTTVEEFSQGLNQWTVVSEMSKGRRRFGCCS